MPNGFHIRGGFGFNAHVLQDIHKVLTGFHDTEGEIFISPQVSDFDAIPFSNGDGTEVWLGRRQIGNEERPYQDVWQISHVVTQTEEALDEFGWLLEGLEEERADQIIESWKNAGWSTDYLETLSDRLIMVVDASLDVGLHSGKVIINDVQLKSAFEDGGAEIVWETSQRNHAYMPDPECIEYIADKIGPYEFVSLEAARVTWYMWRGLNGDHGATECMVAGLEAMGHVRRLSDWVGWEEGIHPFSFISYSDDTKTDDKAKSA